MNLQGRKQGLIWGGLLIFFGAIGLLEAYTDLSAWAWIAILTVAGFIAFSIYLTDRSDMRRLIPAYVLWSVAVLVALITWNVLRDEAIATFVLAAIALPFLMVYLRDRDQGWALISTYILVAVGIMVGLIGLGVLDDLLIPSYVMFAIAIPFFAVYARNPKQWWPLIPAGITAVIGLSFLIAEAAIEYIVPAVLILAGAGVLLRQFTRREEPTKLDETPVTGIEADKSTEK